MRARRPGLAALVALALTAACSDGSTEPEKATPDPPASPATVAIVTAEKTATGFDWEEIAVSFENTGGPGVFIMEVWGIPTSPNGPEIDYGQTEPFTVGSGWTGDGEWRIEVGSPGRVRRLVVLTRDEGSLSYRETDRFSFPSS